MLGFYYSGFIPSTANITAEVVKQKIKGLVVDESDLISKVYERILEIS